MDRQLAEALQHGHGIVEARSVSSRALDNGLRSGYLIRLFPEIYIDATLPMRLSPHGEYRLRCKAALRYVQGKGAISHTSALAILGLVAEPKPVHLTVGPGIRQRSSSGIIVHHHRQPGSRLRRNGVIVTAAADALVDSWPILPADKRIGSVIAAAEARLATVDQIRDSLARSPKLRGRKALVTLLGQIEDGCQSPLEVWGASRVFTGPEFAGLRRQVPIRVAGCLFYLDLYAEDEKVNLELDGAAFHGDSVQRERDLRRDALLLTLGIVVVRYSYARLMSEPDTVRREALAILTSRRR